MKISEVRVVLLEGVLEHQGEFWEERLVRPIDIYPEHRVQGATWIQHLEPGKYWTKSYFVEIKTDEGVTGIGGPFSERHAFIIVRDLKPLLMDQDPLAIERIWDRMYRHQVHGRKGDDMIAISAVDNALWDLKGNWANAPVYSLLGGPTRKEIPAYASMLGYSLDPELVQERVQDLVEQGYGATKWFFRDGPTDGIKGITRNLRLVRTVRESAGPDVDIMFDAWMSWDVPYTLMMAERMREYHPRWIEEPVLPDKIDQYAEIRSRSVVPISGGEHEYTRWGIKQLLEARACDVLQPDIYWAGGISEMMKICALSSAFDVPVVPHGHSPNATAHLLAAWPQTTCPILEYLVKWNHIHQYFLKTPLIPSGGVVTLPDTPGLGMELDYDKAEKQTEITF